ncbi:hypothetical protein [Saccharibacillus sacchari]|uniref:Uncharacterized protein n=1 Tax=Saccharibacillus sacchari TaxID=456493 RepID=A0ACC6P7K9_9BACL
MAIIDIGRIYEQYRTLNIPNPFNDEQIHKRANDENIERVRDLYRDGRYFRYYGAQNGSGIYLYNPKRVKKPSIGNVLAQSEIDVFVEGLFYYCEDPN